MTRAAMLLLLGLLGGCETVCSDILLWGVSVGVTGADTGQPVEATVVVHDGDYVEQLMVVNDRHVGAGERPGTYRVEIVAPGYAPKTVDDVEVDEGGCHVDTARVNVVLDRP